MVQIPLLLRRLGLSAALGLGMLGMRLPAAPAEPAAGTPPATTLQMREELLRMNEFFDTILPGTLKRYNVIMDFSPKFSDLRDREFVRYPIELRYGVREKWELFGGWSPYSPNPINNGSDHRWGAGFAKLGVRHDVGPCFGLYHRVTVGVEARAPFGQPPLVLIDRYSHLRPFVSAARDLGWAHTTFFTTFAYDHAVHTPWRGDEPAEPKRGNVFEVTPGLLYKPGEFGGFVEYRFRQIAEPGDQRLGHMGRVGAIWDLPLRRTRGWGLPGKWQAELGYKVEREDGVGCNHGITASLRWRTSLREMLNYDPSRLVRQITESPERR